MVTTNWTGKSVRKNKANRVASLKLEAASGKRKELSIEPCETKPKGSSRQSVVSGRLEDRRTNKANFGRSLKCEVSSVMQSGRAIVRNEANLREGTLALQGHRAKRSQFPRGHYEP